MKIAVFGLGYVGAVSAACLANDGHEVTGVDVSGTKVESINAGLAPLVEKSVPELIASAVESGRLRATGSAGEAVQSSELSLICVGTPSLPNGDLDLSHVRNVCDEIGRQLALRDDWHCVVVRSTVLPGTIRNVVIPILEQASGKRAGVDFAVCMNPEFLREGSAVEDFYRPPQTVIGAADADAAAKPASLYRSYDAPVVVTSIETAEMVKYTCNVWHALKVGFANEIGNVCKAVEVDAHELMEIFCADTKLNISPSYLRPGFAFGGSCLPKDLRALTYKAKTLDLELPILQAILPSNDLQVERCLRMIRDYDNRRVGVLGLSFKAGTDDLRESPLVEIIERLVGKGYDVKLYDRNVNLARVMGTNRDYVLNRLPHISKLMASSMNEVLEHAETVVVGNADAEFGDVTTRIRPGQTVVDFVRINGASAGTVDYEGICW